MVKKRLFFLVFLLVASTFVSSEDHENHVDQDGFQKIVPYDSNGNVAPGMPFLLTTEEEKPVDVFGDDQEGDDQEDDDQEGEAQPEGEVQPEGEAQPEGEVQPEGEAQPEGEVQPEGDAPSVISQGPHYEQEDENKDPGFDVVKVIKKRKRKVLKTTTVEPHFECEDTDFIKNARQHCIDNPPEGFVASECHFYIQNDDCDWALKCAKTVTEAPSEQEAADAAAAAILEPDEPDSGESDSAESCEPKKKIKFENCFLKIRGLIKKKKPKRCD